MSEVFKDGGFILDTPQDINFFQVARLCSALKLECKGLKMSRGSVYAHCKRTYGFKGNKEKVLAQMVAMKEKMIADKQASVVDETFLG